MSVSTNQIPLLYGIARRFFLVLKCDKRRSWSFVRETSNQRALLYPFVGEFARFVTKQDPIYVSGQVLLINSKIPQMSYIAFSRGFSWLGPKFSTAIRAEDQSTEHDTQNHQNKSVFHHFSLFETETKLACPPGQQAPLSSGAASRSF